MITAPLLVRLATLAAVAAVCVVPIEARAAVGECRCAHAGEVAEDKSELQAKKRTLDSWVARASRYGDEFTRWGIAWNRQLDCARTDAGLFRCKAVGHPCPIRQVPPDKFTPFRRGTSERAKAC